MKSLSVKAALTSLFALMILMIGGLGYLAITKISDVNDNVEAFSNHWFPARDLNARVNVPLGRLRSLEAELILVSEPEKKRSKERNIAETEEKLKTSLIAFGKLGLTGAESKMLDDFKAKWELYASRHAQLMDFVRVNNDDEAIKLHQGEMGALYGDLTGIIDGLRERITDGAKQETVSATQSYAETRFLTLLTVGIGLVLAFGAMLFAFFGVSRPIEQITQSMSALAKGDTSTPIPFGDRNNEIGAMAGAVQVFKDNMIRARQLEAETEANKSKAEADRKRHMQEMAEQFERAVGGIVRTVSDAATELQTAAQSLSSSSSQTTHQSTVVAAASEQAAANVRTVAAAAEELSGSVREISRQVSESANIARKAVAEAEQTNAQVSGLAEGAQKIGAIVDLINDIASKTNLLALNATIEAARAGEAGRGFAVVASEVKALAEQTSKATAEITGHIAGVQSATDLAAHAILGIGKTIDEINHIAATIAAAVEEQGAATEEIARNVDQAAQGTTEVTRNITGVNQAAEASSASAGQVLFSANELATQSEKLRHEMDRFLNTVRAA
jgi:methyl-accepting chemotaxis protein